MRTSVQIESSTASRLLKLAESQRVSVEELLRAHVPGLAAEDGALNGSAEDRAREFEEWVSEFPKDTPPLSDEAISRVSIYHDR